MEFNLKQWRYQHASEEQQPPSAKLPRLLQQQQQEQEQDHHPSGSGSGSGSAALPLFVVAAEHNPKLTDLSAALPSPPADSTTITSTRFPKMGSCYFSMGQWQELELQALIFRHMLAGATVPPQLLHHLLLKKTTTPLLNTIISSLPPPASYFLHHPLQHYHPALLQTGGGGGGHWGRGSMDPEPGRCRRTDGKKWRCSRDVVAGHKYCDRHVHRGRNRSRKPVEISTPSPSSSSTPSAGGSNGVSHGGGSGGSGGGRGGGVPQMNTALATHHTLSGGTHFDLSRPSPLIDPFHLNQRSSESRTENKGLFKAQNEDGKSGAQVLRHFFDDWPRSLQESDNVRTNASSSTCLSIWTPGNPSSDFSLKLATGNGDEPGGHHQQGNAERERPQLNWTGGWGSHQVAPMGGPLAEALRSSISNSSPTSVLHQLQPSSTSETSYVTT
ncbi:hypothetical protein ACSBR1_035931 [Camellia fascicularis]